MSTKAVKIVELIGTGSSMIGCAFCIGSGTMQGFDAHVAYPSCQVSGVEPCLQRHDQRTAISR
jgi:hypothetical protein